jgi:hypothetical protein
MLQRKIKRAENLRFLFSQPAITCLWVNLDVPHDTVGHEVI